MLLRENINAVYGLGGKVEELGIETPFGTKEPIQSNLEEFCCDCSATITPKNDSGWEVFSEDGATTHKICKKCNTKRLMERKKANNGQE